MTAVVLAALRQTLIDTRPDVLESTAAAVVEALDSIGVGTAHLTEVEDRLLFAESWAKERGRRVEELEEQLQRSGEALRLLRSKLDALAAAFAAATGVDANGLDVVRAVADNLDPSQTTGSQDRPA